MKTIQVKSKIVIVLLSLRSSAVCMWSSWSTLFVCKNTNILPNVNQDRLSKIKQILFPDMFDFISGLSFWCLQPCGSTMWSQRSLASLWTCFGKTSPRNCTTTRTPMGTKTSCQPREPCRLLTVPSKLWRNSLQTTETFIQGGLCCGYSQKLIIKMPPLDRVFVYCVFVREKNQWLFCSKKYFGLEPVLRVSTYCLSCKF